MVILPVRELIPKNSPDKTALAEGIERSHNAPDSVAIRRCKAGLE